MQHFMQHFRSKVILPVWGSRLLLTFAAVLAAFWLRESIIRATGAELPPPITFYPAIMLVAIFAGFWYGLLATALCCTIIDFFILEPVGSFAIARTSDAIVVGLFAFMGLLVSAVAAAYRINRRKVAQYETDFALAKVKQESENILRTVMDSASVGLVMVDRERRYAFANEYYVKMYGLSIHDIVGKRVADVMHDVYDQISPQLDRGFSGERVNYELTVPQPEGTPTRYYTVIYEPHRDAGKVIGVIVLVFDVTDRKQANEALRESVERLRLAVDAAKLGTWDTDPALGVLRSSERCRAMFGLAPGEEMPYQTFVDRIHPDDREATNAAVRRAVDPDGNGGYEIEYRLLWPDGTQRWLAANGRVIFETVHGIRKATRFLGTLQDITERKQAEAELNAAKLQAERDAAQLHAVLESMAERLYVCDGNGKVLVANEAVRQTYGDGEYAMAPDVSQLPDEVDTLSLDGHALPFSEWPIGRIMNGERVRSQEIKLVFRRTGKEVILSCNGGPVRDGNGKIIMCVQTAQDITERKRAEDALRESEELLRLFLAHAPVSLAMFDRDMRYLFASPRWMTDHGLSNRDIAGLSYYELLPEIPERWKEFHRRGLAGEVLREDADRFVRADGTETWGKWEIHPWRSAHGDVGGIVVLTEDVTERKRAKDSLLELTLDLENRVKQRTSELEAANKELESFSYSVSHDLRGPLRTMNGFSKVLLENYASDLDEKGKHYVERIGAAADRMGQLIDALLQLSRLARAQFEVKTVNLSELAQRIVEDLRQAEPERKVEVHIQPGLETRGDPSLLFLVLQNLISNSWKFTARRELAHIEFGAEGQNEHRAFFIRDNGAGFNMQYADQLFGPFQRLHSQGDFPGTGIGLATVRRIILRHHGRIWAQAVEDQGATFYFQLSA
jgi:PAS domain S-box-containing protein